MKKKINITIEADEDNETRVSINKGSESIWFWVDKVASTVTIEHTTHGGSTMYSVLKLLENRVEEIKRW